MQGVIPVVGDAAAAALTGAAAAVQLLKGSLALAALLALTALFAPVLLQCAQLCRLYFEGARLCGSMLVLYFFMIFLSTALLLLAGNGGLG